MTLFAAEVEDDHGADRRASARVVPGTGIEPVGREAADFKFFL